MEGVDQSGDTNVSEKGPEDTTPPTEVNNINNHNDKDQSTAAESTPQITAETSKDLPVTPPKSESGGPMIVPGSNKNPASEKLERVRKWSITTYKCTRQALSEKLGRGSRTVDLDLQPRLELLKDDRQRYDHMTKLAQTLANQLAQLSVTQKTLGDVFSVSNLLNYM